MPPLAGNILLYAVLVAPGFLAVFTTISLAAIEQDHKEFTLLVWSLVTSLVIDTGFLYILQIRGFRITSIDQLSTLFFTPYFRMDYVVQILLLSFAVGLIGTFVLLLEVPGRGRQLLQNQSRMSVNPRQPWENFIRETYSIRIKTTDGENYEGVVSEWSRAGRPKELRVSDPYQYNHEVENYVPVGAEEMLFLEGSIDRVIMREKDNRNGFIDRLKTRIQGCIESSGSNGSEPPNDDDEDDDNPNTSTESNAGTEIVEE